MYSVSVEVEGIAPLLQHQFPLPENVVEHLKGTQRSSGKTDYSEEWRKSLYVNSKGEVYQPSSHFERAMVKAAAQFKIQGKRGKTYKDLFSANVTVDPEQIPHGIKEPEDLDFDADKQLYIDFRPVVVQRARVTRLRPAFKPGWKLAFEVEVSDDQIPPEVLKDVLDLAGKTCGVGDHRPKFGRFMVTRFDVHKNGKG